MKKYGVNELRRMYLEFFESKNHLKMNSFSLVPHNDNSLLLINSGMAPLKPYFTGQEIPPRRRVTTCQKAIRTEDIDSIGKDGRHLTFFEMLGNFSFGDYFKEEAITWSWEFLTEVLGLEKEKLYPSVYYEDEEAFELWHKKIGIPKEKITKFYPDENGECDNFWEHGAGPCGPCSEIYYDRGEKYGCGRPDCKVGCDCDRFMEVWNNVFTQFEGDGKGNYTELVQKNIDTGMGLERLGLVVQNVDSVFDLDTMKAIRDKVCEIAGIEYHSDKEKDVSVRLITDHMRSATFLISDGVMPTNKGRGYVLRRLIRRVARHGRLLGIEEAFLAKLSAVVIQESKDGYPELEEKKEFIFRVLTEEESKFNKTIDLGLGILSDLMNDLTEKDKSVLPGEDVFRLYDTYGFPLDLTMEILEEKGMTLDEKGFFACMEEQRKKARGARKETNYMGADATVYEEIDTAITSVFIGYDTLQAESEIVALTNESEVIQALADGDIGTLIVKETPFYATMGGQEGDTGTITSGESVFEVVQTIKLSGGKIGHVGKVTKGMFKLGDVVSLRVDETLRNGTCKNHSATHLLQKALRMVLGTHVQQKGSLVTPDRLRFDFSHFEAMTTEEIAKTEEIVNREIEHALQVRTEEMSMEEARRTGAMALFDEKYGETVRVVSMGDFSVELCGGTHVSNTGTIGMFKIVSEAGIAAGVRRIEALTSQGVLKYYAEIEKELNQAAKTAKSDTAGLVKKIEAMQEDLRKLHSENEKLKSQIANASLGDITNQIVEVSGVKLLATRVDGVDMNGLRNLGDQLKNKIGEGVVLIASAEGDSKVNLLAMATDEAQKKGAHAGNLIKAVAAVVGGGGGGRPNMAQAGGKNPEAIGEALKEASNVLKGQIK